MSTRIRTARFVALIAALLLTVMGTPPAKAQTIEEAVVAYKRGDHGTAFRAFRTYAEQGHADARNYLGFMYAEGQGVPQDYAVALRWYRRAAEQGHPDAQFNLGLMYAEGQGVPQDYAEALRWYHRAAEQGYAYAQVDLGSMYKYGVGVPQDFVLAHKWYNLAASGASSSDAGIRKFAIRDRDAVAEGLTPAQLAKAQRLAREWHLQTSTAEPPVHE